MSPTLDPSITLLSQRRFQQMVIDHGGTLHDALTAINTAATGICLVVKDGQLAGVLTDGDIRRALIDGAPTSDALVGYMSTNPVVANSGDELVDIAALMVGHRVPLVPVVDDQRRPTGVYSYRDLAAPTQVRALAVIMAGGRGSRMGELTDEIPKPMLPIAGRPMLERLVRRLVAQGVRTIAISVNYHANAIIDYFGTGAKFGCEIRYLEEAAEIPLGTAGSLSLLGGCEFAVTEPTLVMNSDVVAEIDVRELLAHHRTAEAMVTVCTATHSHTVPYGVVASSSGLITNIREKPTVRWEVNAGIYVLSQAVIDTVPHGTFFQMTDLIEKVQAEGDRVVPYQLPGLWLDVGDPQGIDRAAQSSAIQNG